MVNNTAEASIADLLLAAYDAGYCAALGHAPELHAAPHLADLLTTLAARHRCEVLASRGWTEPTLMNDEIPGWLLAHCERENALGDARPPEGWLRRAGSDGKP